jgi:hypothetical protein
MSQDKLSPEQAHTALQMLVQKIKGQHLAQSVEEEFKFAIPEQYTKAQPKLKGVNSRPTIFGTAGQQPGGGVAYATAYNASVAPSTFAVQVVGNIDQLTGYYLPGGVYYCLTRMGFFQWVEAANGQWTSTIDGQGNGTWVPVWIDPTSLIVHQIKVTTKPATPEVELTDEDAKDKFHAFENNLQLKTFGEGRLDLEKQKNDSEPAEPGTSDPEVRAWFDKAQRSK